MEAIDWSLESSLQQCIQNESVNFTLIEHKDGLRLVPTNIEQDFSHIIEFDIGGQHIRIIDQYGKAGGFYCTETVKFMYVIVECAATSTFTERNYDPKLIDIWINRFGLPFLKCIFLYGRSLIDQITILQYGCYDNVPFESDINPDMW